MSNKIYEDVVRAIALLNKTRDAEYCLAYAPSITEHSVFIWPATGNHTVWHDIALFCYSFDQFAYPTTEVVEGVERLVFKACIWSEAFRNSCNGSSI